MNTRHALDVIAVRSPCTAEWGRMRGDDKSRFCGHCQKHVHNLSAMSADEAERLVCESAGRLCVRFARDEHGKVMTLDYWGSDRRRWTWKAWTLIALAGALITGSVQAVLYGQRIRVGGPTVVAGNMAPIPRAVTGKIAPNPGTAVLGEMARTVQNPPVTTPVQEE
jgi:hypothetical protein